MKPPKLSVILLSMLIVFEGIDGSGKTTMAKHLTIRLRLLGYPAVYHREPGTTELGEYIAKVIQRDNPSPTTKLFLFLAARSNLVEEKLIPLLKSGGVVVLDRFIYSTLAYQSVEGIDTQLLAILNNLALNELNSIPKREVVFLLDVPVEVALKRKKNAGDPEKLTLVREKYLELAKADPKFIIIDATKSENEVFDEVLTHLLTLKGEP